MRSIILVLVALAWGGCDSFVPPAESSVHTDPTRPPQPTPTPAPEGVGFFPTTSLVDASEPEPLVAVYQLRASRANDADSGALDGGVRDGGRACAFDLPEFPDGEEIDLDRVNVEATVEAGQVSIGRVSSEQDCAAFAGWYLDDPVNPTGVFLCPDACVAITGDVLLRLGTVWSGAPSR